VKDPSKDLQKQDRGREGTRATAGEMIRRGRGVERRDPEDIFVKRKRQPIGEG